MTKSTKPRKSTPAPLQLHRPYAPGNLEFKTAFKYVSSKTQRNKRLLYAVMTLTNEAYHIGLGQGWRNYRDRLRDMLGLND